MINTVVIAPTPLFIFNTLITLKYVMLHIEILLYCIIAQIKSAENHSVCTWNIRVQIRKLMKERKWLAVVE